MAFTFETPITNEEDALQFAQLIQKLKKISGEVLEKHFQAVNDTERHFKSHVEQWSDIHTAASNCISIMTQSEEKSKVSLAREASEHIQATAVNFAGYIFDGQFGRPADEDQFFVALDEDTANEDVAKALFPLAPGGKAIREHFRVLAESGRYPQYSGLESAEGGYLPYKERMATMCG